MPRLTLDKNNDIVERHEPGDEEFIVYGMMYWLTDEGLEKIERDERVDERYVRRLLHGEIVGDESNWGSKQVYGLALLDNALKGEGKCDDHYKAIMVEAFKDAMAKGMDIKYVKKYGRFVPTLASLDAEGK